MSEAKRWVPVFKCRLCGDAVQSGFSEDGDPREKLQQASTFLGQYNLFAIHQHPDGSFGLADLLGYRPGTSIEDLEAAGG